MNTIIKTNKPSILLAMLFLFTFFNATATKNTVLVTTTYIKIGVNGLACPFCAYGLEKKIKKIKEAKNFYVDINEGFITFDVPTDKKPSAEELKKLVKEAGFKVRDIEYATTPFKVKKDEKK